MERLTPEKKQKHVTIKKKTGAVLLSLGMLASGCGLVGGEEGIEPCLANSAQSVNLEAGMTDEDFLQNPNNIMEIIKQKYGHEVTDDNRELIPDEARKVEAWGEGNHYWPKWKDGEDLLCFTDEGELSLNDEGLQLKAEAEAFLAQK